MSGSKNTFRYTFSNPAQLKFSILAVELQGWVRPFWKAEQFCSSGKLKWPGISFGKAEQCRLKDGWSTTNFFYSPFKQGSGGGGARAFVLRDIDSSKRHFL